LGVIVIAGLGTVLIALCVELAGRVIPSLGSPGPVRVWSTSIRHCSAVELRCCLALPVPVKVTQHSKLGTVMDLLVNLVKHE
jgi:hypothetical protein